MGQIRPSLGKGSNATIPRHMGFSTPICRKVVYDPFCIFFPMMIFWKIKVNYVYLANFKLESGLRIRVTILDRRRRQRVKSVKTIVFESEFINFKEHCLFPTYDKLFYMKNIYLISQKVSFFCVWKRYFSLKRCIFVKNLLTAAWWIHSLKLKVHLLTTI